MAGMSRDRRDDRRPFAAKAAAVALNISRQAGMLVECPAVVPRDAETTMKVHLYDEKGAALDADRVWAEFTPTNDCAFPLTRTGEGTYQLPLSIENLPRLYNYTSKIYEAFRGPLRIRVAAEAGTRSVSHLVDVMVGGAREPAPTRP